MTEIKSNVTPSRTQIIADFAQHPGDTGSSDVQVALLTHRINELNLHLKTHAKDFASRRGLLQLVNQRRSLLTYIKKNDSKRYETLLARLGLRK